MLSPTNTAACGAPKQNHGNRHKQLWKPGIIIWNKPIFPHTHNKQHACGLCHKRMLLRLQHCKRMSVSIEVTGLRTYYTGQTQNFSSHMCIWLKTSALTHVSDSKLQLSHVYQTQNFSSHTCIRPKTSALTRVPDSKLQLSHVYQTHYPSRFMVQYQRLHWKQRKIK